MFCDQLKSIKLNRNRTEPRSSFYSRDPPAESTPVLPDELVEVGVPSQSDPPRQHVVFRYLLLQFPNNLFLKF